MINIHLSFLASNRKTRRFRCFRSIKVASTNVMWKMSTPWILLPQEFISDLQHPNNYHAIQSQCWFYDFMILWFSPMYYLYFMDPIRKAKNTSNANTGYFCEIWSESKYFFIISSFATVFMNDRNYQLQIIWNNYSKKLLSKYTVSWVRFSSLKKRFWNAKYVFNTFLMKIIPNIQNWKKGISHPTNMFFFKYSFLEIVSIFWEYYHFLCSFWMLEIISI